MSQFWDILSGDFACCSLLKEHKSNFIGKFSIAVSVNIVTLQSEKKDFLGTDSLWGQCSTDPLRLHVPFQGQKHIILEVLQQVAELGVTKVSASMEHMQTVTNSVDSWRRKVAKEMKRMFCWYLFSLLAFYFVTVLVSTTRVLYVNDVKFVIQAGLDLEHC